MKILITGFNGMLGKKLTFKLRHNKEYENDIILGIEHKKCDLTSFEQTYKIFQNYQPDIIYHFASLVGGIKYNKEHKVDILLKNNEINNNVLSCSQSSGVKKLIFTASTCMYPAGINRPINEKDLFTGQLEPTNDSYAVSKINGFFLCKAFYEQYNSNFITVCPTNMYGEFDNFDPNNGHAIASIIYKIRQAKEQKVKAIFFGDGTPMRDWLYVGDAVDMILWIMKNYDNPLKQINLSTRAYMRNCNLIKMICDFMDYDYKKIEFDYDMAKNGMLNKITDTSYLESLGYKIFPDMEWISLKRTIKWYFSNYKWDGKKYIRQES